jgi:hypothetical protein
MSMPRISAFWTLPSAKDDAENTAQDNASKSAKRDIKDRHER